MLFLRLFKAKMRIFAASILTDRQQKLVKGGENGFETWASIHCLYAAKAVPMNGAPSSNADKLHFEDLPENELPQWQQKIALRAENKLGY